MTLETAASLGSEVRDGMRIDWDVPIVMDDGVVIRADVYRPVDEGQYPVIANYGPYGKNLPLQDPPYTNLWNAMVEKYPDVPRGSTNKYQAWEVADPEKWVAHGYAVLRADSRGAGRSEGVIDCFSPREAQDFTAVIEWAGTQPWSNGKVGLSGISYYAVNQWHVAGLNPPHLAAICPWEGFGDHYRDLNYHGGIPTPWLGKYWYPVQTESVQHGLGTRGARNPHTGMLVSGDVNLTDAELMANRVDIAGEIASHPFDDDYHRARSAKWANITVPILSCANWGGQGLHNRGNFMGFMESASKQKWLEVHGGEHWTIYYTDYGRELQMRFFDYFLKAEGDWPASQPKVSLQIRHPGERFVRRAENEWPLARTQWREAYLAPGSKQLTFERPAEESTGIYRGFGEGVTLYMAPFEAETEITGPVSCKLWISSSTTDADIFLALRLFDVDGKEVLFHGANDPKAPIGQGWLRASHRKLDPEKSTPWRQYHLHLKAEPLQPRQVYELDIEIWATCIVAPPGHRLALSIMGRDFDHGLEGVASHLGIELRGSSLHIHPDRPADPYDGDVTVYGGGNRAAYVLLPIIPQR
jgi:hypothetical protein